MTPGRTCIHVCRSNLTSFSSQCQDFKKVLEAGDRIRIIIHNNDALVWCRPTFQILARFWGPRQQVIKLLIINLVVVRFQLKFGAVFFHFLVYLDENIVDGPRNNSVHALSCLGYFSITVNDFFDHFIWTQHRKCFTRPTLTIREYRAVKAIHKGSDFVFRCQIVHSLVVDIAVKYIIEGEAGCIKRILSHFRTDKRTPIRLELPFWIVSLPSTESAHHFN